MRLRRLIQRFPRYENSAGAAAVREMFQQSGRLGTVEQLAMDFTADMVKRGFGIITANEVDDAAKKAGWGGGKTGIVKDNETIFNLGLGKSRSNFFVFMKETSDGIEIFYSSPRSDDAALLFTHDDLYLKRKIMATGTDRTTEIKKVIDEVIDVSDAKFVEDLRMQTHHHGTYLFDRHFEHTKLPDDASSNIADIIRKAMLYHTDVWNFTPHNTSNKKIHQILDGVVNVLGITYVPGTELTGTLEKDGINGPHIVMMFDGYGKGTAEEQIWKKVIARMHQFNMVSYFRGLSFERMDKIMQMLRNEGKLVIGFAHTVNCNTKTLPILAVGLLSAVETGAYDLKTALQLLKYSDAVAAYNPTLCDEDMAGMIHSDELKGWLYARIAEYGLGTKLTANACNLAVAQYAEKVLKMGSFYESDEHTCTPLDAYSTGADGFAKGFTRILLKPELAKKWLESGKKLTVKELIEWVGTREAMLHAKVFYEVVDGEVKLAKARTEDTRYSEFERKKLVVRQQIEYVKALAKDWAYFLQHRGEWKHLFALDK
ncbi:MAG: hypothetical protein WCT31_02600 [Candidatus Micrarchaeia archaeon]|jgi:hypothetical protein